MRSDVFKAMLNDEQTEEFQTSIIKLGHTPSSTVRHFVNYLYTDQISNQATGTEVLDLFEMADKYMVEKLHRDAELLLIAKTDLELLPEVLILSHLLDVRKLFVITLKRACDNMEECMKMKDWEKVKQYPTIINELLKVAVDMKKK